MPSEYVAKADLGHVIFTVTVGARRTPSDDHADKLRERRREITRKLGDEADALRAEAKTIDAALLAYDNAKKPKRRKKAKR